LQIYQLQTENDEEETWNDLVCAKSLEYVISINVLTSIQSTHGFDRNLHLVSSRREEDDSHDFQYEDEDEDEYEYQDAMEH
jgi:hypothetical protein